MSEMTAMTTWERWAAGLPARDKDERARYREYAAACVTEIGYPEPDNGPLQVLRSPKPEESAA
jgi:hypothetical protein